MPPSLTQVRRVAHEFLGWYSLKRENFASKFHTYAMEWDTDYMRFYTDNKLHAMLDLRTGSSKESFWHRGGFPETAQNGSSEVVVQNPWSSSSNYNAPFDQGECSYDQRGDSLTPKSWVAFYLIINLSAGGTSGWFPDSVGNKPWSVLSSSRSRSKG